MGVRFILFVEDDPKIIDLMEIAVETWNTAHVEQNRLFELENCRTADEAREALERTRYDCALFDLRLPGENKGKRTEPLGNELALYALQQLGIPVAIMSGNPGDMDDRLKQFETVQLFFKGDKTAYSDAVTWFGSWWEMMDVVAGSRQRIQASSAEIFLKRLWPQWKDFAAIEQTGGGDLSLTEIVTRQYVSHVAELLGLDGPDGVKWHPFESYVIPSLWSHRSHTGDIFDIDGEFRIVLTPQCDMSRQNVTSVILGNCKRGHQDWTVCIEKLRAADTPEKKQKAGRYFRDMVNQQYAISQHFLPPLPGDGEPLLVDFADVTVLPLPELNNRLEDRIASVSAPFLPNLTQRFGAYISRTGQPDIDVEHFCR